MVTEGTPGLTLLRPSREAGTAVAAPEGVSAIPMAAAINGISNAAAASTHAPGILVPGLSGMNGRAVSTSSVSDMQVPYSMGLDPQNTRMQRNFDASFGQ